jgi:hypothetical protein
VLATTLRLKQICNHPDQGLAQAGFAPEESGKFLRLAEICEPIAARQEKVLVFTQFQTLCEPLVWFGTPFALTLRRSSWTTRDRRAAGTSAHISRFRFRTSHESFRRSGESVS